jgi:hypothetical protein
VKQRQTVDAIVGAVTGSLTRREVLMVGRYRGKELEVIGRTVMLKDDQSAEIGQLLKPAGPRHPWPDEISTHWGKGSKTPLVKVQPRWSSRSPPTPPCRPATTGTRCGWFVTAPTWPLAMSRRSPPDRRDRSSSVAELALGVCSASRWRRVGASAPRHALTEVPEPDHRDRRRRGSVPHADPVTGSAEDRASGGSPLQRPAQRARRAVISQAAEPSRTPSGVW